MPTAPGSAPGGPVASPAYPELAIDGTFTAGLASWPPQWGTPARVVASTERPGGAAIETLPGIPGDPRLMQAVQGLEAGQSYTLTVRARAVSGTDAEVAMRFFETSWGEAFHSSKIVVESTAYTTYSIDLVAPTYVGNARLTIEANSSQAIIDSVSLRKRAPLVQTQPVADASTSFVPAGYVLSFNDEFNGGALDRIKWQTRTIHSNESMDFLNDEWQVYRDNDNHRVVNGELQLIARRTKARDPSLYWSNPPADPNYDPARYRVYESGMIRSRYTQMYGYYEVRAWMPDAKGMWPAFWLLAEPNTSGHIGWPPEVDIFEFVNNGVEDTPNMMHTGVIAQDWRQPAPFLYMDASFTPSWTYWTAPFDFTAGWHTFGLEWLPNGDMTTYIDGRKIVTRQYSWTHPEEPGRTYAGEPAGPAYVLLNLAVGGRGWAARYGVDDAKLTSPNHQALRIDWVRVYKKSS